MARRTEPRTSYGGQWTIEKLDILERYLDAYTTALKDQPFKLVYLDAFAGTGYVEFGRGEDADFIRGSARRAINVADKPFDELIFVEKDPGRCTELESLKNELPRRNIRIENSDANDFLRGLQKDWHGWRGVLFLDPFATQIQWPTIEAVAGFEALDTWILFPTSAVARMLPNSRRPDDIEPKWADRLTIVFGNESWRHLYQPSRQASLFGDPGLERTEGVDGLRSIYKQNLGKLFGDRFLEESRTLRNSRNAPLFEFIFCVGSPRGIGPAKRIARHILEKL